MIEGELFIKIKICEMMEEILYVATGNIFPVII
jgi:hypothetical protein